jgi:hypothetical protein
MPIAILTYHHHKLSDLTHQAVTVVYVVNAWPLASPHSLVYET